MTTPPMSTSPSSPSTSSLSPPSNSSHASSSSHHRHNLPPPPPADRMPPPKGRSGHHKLNKLVRKGKHKERGGLSPGAVDDDEEWTLEGGMNGNERESLDMSRPTVQEPQEMLDSQLTEVPSREEKKSKGGGGLVKKTSQLFSRSRERDRDKDGYRLPTPTDSLNPASANSSRQASYSSTISASSDTSSSRRFAALTRPLSHHSNTIKSPRSSQSHSRRPSQDSQSSWQAAPRSIRSGSSSYDSPPDSNRLPIPHRQNSSQLSASVPGLSRHALPAPAPPQSRSATTDTLPSRMSTWISHLLPSSSAASITDPSASSSTTPPPTDNSNSPVRKTPSAAASFLNAARQRAADGIRHFMDTEATPDRCPDDMWVMGVRHPGYRPTTPSQSPSERSVDLPPAAEERRRGSGSSDKPSPPQPQRTGSLRPTAWKRDRDREREKEATSSPPGKGGFSNLFSTSTLSLAMPSSGSPSQNGVDETRGGTSESPGKGRKSRAEREAPKWPDQFFDDFRSRIWCTYRSQYSPILTLPSSLLIPSAHAYYSAFGPPVDAASPPRPSRDANSLVAAQQQARAWSWGATAERGLTSDSGWGCMLRTGQSMLANALIHLHLGRDWRLPNDRPSLAPRTSREIAMIEQYASYSRILSWFLDDPSPLCPFSVHRMALIGKELGKEVGEWFGPSTAAGALKTLANSFPPCGLAVATATDSMVYKSDVYAASNLVSPGWGEEGGESARGPGKARRGSAASTTWGRKAVLILIGVRLGLDGVNPIYYESIKEVFTFPQSVGIAGGRPSSSYYFVASQANSLFYLDPHISRPAIPLETPPAPTRQAKTSALDEDPVVVDRGEGEEEEELDEEAPYTLDVVDVDDLSDDSAASSPTAQAKTKRISLPRPVAPPDTPEGEVPSDPFVSTAPAGPSTLTPTRHRSMRGGDEREEKRVDPETRWWVEAYYPEALRTFHCERVKKMPLSGLDPSMLLGFLVRDEADFEDFVARVAELPQKIFTVHDEPMRWDEDDDAGLESVSEPELDDLALEDDEPAERDAEGDETLGAVDVGDIVRQRGLEKGHAARPSGVDQSEERDWAEAAGVEPEEVLVPRKGLEREETIRDDAVNGDGGLRPGGLSAAGREESWVHPDRSEMGL